jgi:hypothetical protein
MSVRAKQLVAIARATYQAMLDNEVKETVFLHVRNEPTDEDWCNPSSFDNQPFVKDSYNLCVTRALMEDERTELVIELTTDKPTEEPETKTTTEAPVSS